MNGLAGDTLFSRHGRSAAPSSRLAAAATTSVGWISTSYAAARRVAVGHDRLPVDCGAARLLTEDAHCLPHRTDRRFIVAVTAAFKGQVRKLSGAVRSSNGVTAQG